MVARAVPAAEAVAPQTTPQHLVSRDKMAMLHAARLPLGQKERQVYSEVELHGVWQVKLEARVIRL